MKYKHFKQALLFKVGSKVYIDEHHHLPDKHKVENRGLLNFSKYTRKKIKEGTCDEWKGEMFEGLMAERWMDEHTGGRKKSPI